jgi:hypothetical protein
MWPTLSSAAPESKAPFSAFSKTSATASTQSTKEVQHIRLLYEGRVVTTDLKHPGKGMATISAAAVGLLQA